MVELLAIAGAVLAGLVIFALGLYLVNIAFRVITKSSTHQERFLGRTVPLAIIALIAAIALQQIKSVSVINNSAFKLAEVTISGTQRTTASNGWNNVALGGGGYVTGIYLHPLQKDLVYIKTDVGGFYRWNPLEQSWVPITDHFPLSQRRYYGGEALALDPKDPNIVYIAAGTYVWDKPGTIFKSTDRGATWTKLNIDLPMGGNQNKRWMGERLAVNPFNSNLILFGSRNDGLWKSSNAGTSWTKVNSFPVTLRKNIGITAILFDKQVSGLVYAVAYEDGIYKSTDAGVSWNKIEGSPKWPRRMAIGRNGKLYVTSGKGPGVTKYANGVWSNITPENSPAIFNAVTVNPIDPNQILVSLGETPSTRIYISTDEGNTWTRMRRSMNSTVPWWTRIMRSQAWISAIEFDPKVPGRVWLTDWYGIWRTDKIETNPTVWTNYQKGHEEVVTFALASPPKGAKLLSGLADVDGFYHPNLDTYPSKSFGGNGPDFQDTYSIAYNESDPLKIVRIGGKRWNNTFGGATSTDGGLTWQEFASFPANKMPMRVAMSATNPNLFVVSISGGNALRTDDGGVSWSEVSGLPDGPKGPWNLSQSLAADTMDGNTFYYYAKGKFYRSTDGGVSFKIVNESVSRESWHSVKTLSGVKGEVWLSLNQQGLYRSTDGGKTFSQIKGVERAYLFALGKPQPGSTISALYLYGKISGMGEGIFRSLDRGKTWISISDRANPIGNNPQVMEASKQDFGLVFIGTGGRGIFYRTSP